MNLIHRHGLIMSILIEIRCKNFSMKLKYRIQRSKKLYKLIWEDEILFQNFFLFNN